jgi:hypothetical protein
MKNNEEKKVDVKIQSTRGTKDFTFSDDAKVAPVIEEAVREFKFAPGDRFELVLASNPKEVLQPDRTLESYHIKNGTVLILTAIGSGV